jgi:hypothetical protein
MLLVIPYSERCSISRTETDLTQQASDLTVYLTKSTTLTPSRLISEHDLTQHRSLVSHLARHEHEITVKRRSKPRCTARPDAMPQFFAVSAKRSMRLRYITRKRRKRNDVSMLRQLALTQIP